MAFPRGSAFVVLAALAGCGGKSDTTSSSNSSGGGSGGVANANPTAFATSFCTKALGCGSAPANCTDVISAVIWPMDCQDALLQASCADIDMQSLPPALAALCTPPCSPPGTYQCNPDGTVTECTTKGVHEIADCHGVCAYQGMTFSGTCGDTYMGLVSSKGHAVCWCQ